MSIFKAISSIIKPVTNIIDDFTLTKEEKLRLRTEFTKLENEIMIKCLDYEKDLNKSKADIIKAEATGKSWLQRNWRPVTMITFLTLIVLDSLNILPNKLAPEMWALMKIGLGGYVVGRSLEKVAPSVSKIMSQRREI